MFRARNAKIRACDADPTGARRHVAGQRPATAATNDNLSFSGTALPQY